MRRIGRKPRFKDEGKNAAEGKKTSQTQTRPTLPMRVQSLRYRNSLRKETGLRASALSN